MTGTNYLGIYLEMLFVRMVFHACGIHIISPPPPPPKKKEILGQLTHLQVASLPILLHPLIGAECRY